VHPILLFRNAIHASTYNDTCTKRFT
jgi:hypothetical protein